MRTVPKTQTGIGYTHTSTTTCDLLIVISVTSYDARWILNQNSWVEGGGKIQDPKYFLNDSNAQF